MNRPLVSIIIPTRNSAATLDACLASIQAQTYPHIETIVVDRHSSDTTPVIAQDYSAQFYQHPGPERSAQRNSGAGCANGDYLLMIDSDMELTPEVVEACVNLAQSQPELAAITIPEDSFGLGFWSKCKALERSYYNGVDWIESPRFFPARLYQDVRGYDETIVGGEDWDLTQKLRAKGPFGRVPHVIRHNEGRIRLTHLLKKRFYYAEGFSRYYAKGRASKYSDGLRFYALFLADPIKIIQHPVLWTGMMIMRTSEFAAGAMAYFAQRFHPKQELN